MKDCCPQSVLEELLVLALHHSGGVSAVPGESTDAVEREIDAWVLEMVQGKPPRLPEPHWYGVLIPRVRFALTFRATVEARFRLLARVDEVEVNDAEILEWLLVRIWRETGRDQWLAGKFE